MQNGTKAEYLNIICTPHASKRIMEAGRCQDVEWTYCGCKIAHKTTIFTRKGSSEIESESFMIDPAFLTDTQ